MLPSWPYVDYPALVPVHGQGPVQSRSRPPCRPVLPVRTSSKGPPPFRPRPSGPRFTFWLQASRLRRTSPRIGEQAVEAGEDGFMGGSAARRLNALFSAVLSAKPGVKLGGPGYILQGGPSVDEALVSLGGKGTIISGYTAFPTETNIAAVRLFEQGDRQGRPDRQVHRGLVHDLAGRLRGHPDPEVHDVGPINARTITTAMQHTKNLNMLGCGSQLELQLRLARPRVHERLQRYEGILTSAKRRDPEQREQAVYTLPTAVINYYKAHESSARTVS